MCRVSDSSGFSGEVLSDKAGQRQSWGAKTSGWSLQQGSQGETKTKTQPQRGPEAGGKTPSSKNSSQLIKLSRLSGLFPGLGRSQVDNQAGECVSSTDRGKKNCT